MNISGIVNEEKCLSCGLCKSICPVGAIELEYMKKRGVYQPTIINKKCIECSKCISNCIANNNMLHKNLIGTVLQGYLAHATDIHVRTNATSGGVINRLVYYLLDSDEVEAVVMVVRDELSPIEASSKVFTRENGDELSPGVNQAVRIYIAQKRKISVGDKMAGRHGNKGVVSRVLPVEDMPFLPNGRPLDIVLNPLGVPSRMNIGQVLEIHLSLAAKALGFNVATPVFDGASEIDIQDTLELANDYVNIEDFEEFRAKYQDTLAPDVMEYLDENKDHRELWKGVPISRDGKVQLRDGRTGEYFDGRVTIGHMHYLKLHHLVDDKIHARSTGPYSLVTQQPLGGKAQFGGQRFGEMEVWALEAYGASYTLQEILTVKSDDVVGRVKTYEAIIKGDNIPEPGIPESFKVLLKELQSLGLDVKVLRDDNTEVHLLETVDYGDTDLRSVIEGDSRHHREEESFGKHGYTKQEFEGEELVDVEEEEDEDDDFIDFDDSYDDEDNE